MNSCCYGTGMRIQRHDYIVNKMICKIKNHRKPQPACKSNNNLTSQGKKPDIIFSLNRELWALDVVYSTDERLLDNYNNKILKYNHDFCNRIIPLVIKHNGEIYDKSAKFLELLPEITYDWLC